MTSAASLPDISFADARDLLLEILGLDPDAQPAMRARIRQLQKLGLDQLEARYARRDYGLTELTKLATAFRLMQAFMLPSIAVRYLTERWSDFVPALLAGIDHDFASELGVRRLIPATPLVLIEGIALNRFGQKGANDARYDGPLGMIICLPAENAKLEVQKPASGLLLDTRSFMPALLNGLQIKAALSGRQLAHEIDRLAAS